MRLEGNRRGGAGMSSHDQRVDIQRELVEHLRKLADDIEAKAGLAKWSANISDVNPIQQRVTAIIAWGPSNISGSIAWTRSTPVDHEAAPPGTFQRIIK